ncbi:MAG: magnesium/cobalt efflux protein [Aquificaceae bacterium]|nr:MAG: magnesium/cobalt efflux protein [Aquificaceae bacterium]
MIKNIGVKLRTRWIKWLRKKIDLSALNQDELLDYLRQSYKNNIIDAGVLGMMEGVMRVDTYQVRDVMIPRSRMNFLHITDTYHAILEKTRQTGHSRYPVFDDDRDDIEGILLVKDLLKYVGHEEEFNIKDILRLPLTVPESTKLDNLLTSFRNKRNHMALVVNEYGGTAGLITIEDVLEQIVGEIDDEHDDIDDHKKDIVDHGKNHYMVKPSTEIEFFNNFFGSKLPQDKFDTVAGVITHELGHIPKSGEELSFGNLLFHIKNSDGRRIKLLQVIKEST